MSSCCQANRLPARQLSYPRARSTFRLPACKIHPLTQPPFRLHADPFVHALVLTSAESPTRQIPDRYLVNLPSTPSFPFRLPSARPSVRGTGILLCVCVGGGVVQYVVGPSIAARSPAHLSSCSPKPNDYSSVHPPNV